MPPSIRVFGPLVALVFSAGLWAGEPRPLLARDPGPIGDPALGEGLPTPPAGPRDGGQTYETPLPRREEPRESSAMFPRAVGPGGPLESPAERDEPSNRLTEPGDRGTAARSGAAVTRLPPPGQGGQARDAASSAHRGGPQGVLTVVSSLGVVLGLFLVVAWAMRRATPGQVGLLPREVVEVLGKAPLAARQQVHLIRLGNKLVLLSVTPAGTEALSEVTEPEEVQRLTGLCRQAQPNSSTAMFRQVLRQFTGEHERARLGVGSDHSGREGQIRGEGNDG